MTDEEFTAELNALRPKVFAYARTLCREPEAAEDLAQDALVRAWQYRAHVHSNMAGWLRKVVYTAFVNTCRKSPKHTSLDAIPAESEALMDCVDIARDAENRDIIRRALSTPKARECLGFLVNTDLSTNEYADKIGVNRQTFKVRVLRMRQRLAQKGLS